jgi:hypothetical protein
MSRRRGRSDLATTSGQVADSPASRPGHVRSAGGGWRCSNGSRSMSSQRALPRSGLLNSNGLQSGDDLTAAQNSPTIAPSDFWQRFTYVVSFTLSDMKRTEPSHNRNSAPPVCQLLKPAVFRSM